eukprot:558982-Rhodomonas_salina.2
MDPTAVPGYPGIGYWQTSDYYEEFLLVVLVPAGSRSSQNNLAARAVRPRPDAIQVGPRYTTYRNCAQLCRSGSPEPQVPAGGR